MMLASPARALDRVPACRIDDTFKPLVGQTLDRSIRSYDKLGNHLPIRRIAVNEEVASDDAGVLHVVIVRDAGQRAVSSEGCATAPMAVGEPLDPLSVRGGCAVTAIESMELRCSSGALEVFTSSTQRRGRASPTLLYVLSHELAHVYQRWIGHYAGGVERVELAQERTIKIRALREGCDPVSTNREEQADAMALQVLIDLLVAPPYREETFSERGSLYWNIDLLALGSNAWEKYVLESEFAIEPKMHSSFVPTQFPTPARVVDAKARRFVCDILTKRSGSVVYPGKSGTHPPLEQRLRRIAEPLRPVAEQLPLSGAQADFVPVARLQQNVSPILTHIYRETGVFLESLQEKICTAINAPKPEQACR